MRATALMLSLVLASVAWAGDAPAAHHRGWLTGVGIVLVGASLTVGGVTLDSLLTTQDADRLLKVYYPTEGAAPRSIELATVRAIEARRSTAQALILPTGVASGACLLLGITALIIDGLTGQAMPSTVAVGLAPTRDGFTAGLHVSF